jgi:hypothetical protein
MTRAHPTVEPAPVTRRAAVHRPHRRLLAVSGLALAFVVSGCAAPTVSAPDAEVPAAVSASARGSTPASVPATTVTSTASSPTAPADASAPEVWESRDLTPATSRTSSRVAPAPTVVSPAPRPVTPPAPLPVPTPTPEPAPVPAHVPPDLVVGDDGCVTDTTTGLIVTCHDPAAGPDEDPALG